MYVVKLKSIVLFFLLGVFILASGNYLYKRERKIETISNDFQQVIVIDAGHGFPDRRCHQW